MNDTPAGEPMTYAEAAEELEEILAEIENGDTDLDELEQKVSRAAELIRQCRARIESTETKVRKVIEQLGETAPEARAAADDDEAEAGDVPWSS